MQSLLKDLCRYLPAPPLIWHDNIGALSTAAIQFSCTNQTHWSGLPFCARKSSKKLFFVQYISTVDNMADFSLKAYLHHDFSFSVASWPLDLPRSTLEGVIAHRLAHHPKFNESQDFSKSYNFKISSNHRGFVGPPFSERLHLHNPFIKSYSSCIYSMTIYIYKFYPTDKLSGCDRNFINL